MHVLATDEKMRAVVNISLLKVIFRTNVNFAERISRPGYDCGFTWGVNINL